MNSIKALGGAICIATLLAGVQTGAASLSVGKVDFENSGAQQAQAAFQLGMALLHNFEYPLAADAFREAQAADHDFALAYWGEAMTHHHSLWMRQDREAALAALERLAPSAAEREALAPTAREKAYLRAAEVLFGDGEKVDRDHAYSRALEAIVRDFPDDPDAAAFYSLSILGAAHEGRDHTTYMRAAAVAEEVFAQYPEHPGAAHYLIHSYDDPVHAPLGLRPARIYARIAPDAGHAQHMTSHIFLALGMWDDVITANQNSSAVMNRVLAGQGRPPFHCGHSNMWLLYGYLQADRRDEAAALLSGCNADRKSVPAKQSGINPDGSPLHSWLVMRLRFLLDTGEWDSEVAMQVADIPEDFSAEHLTYEFTQGYGAAVRGDLAGARRHLAKLQRQRVAFGRQIAGTLYADTPRFTGRAALLEQQLEAMILGADGKLADAIEVMRAAADQEAAMPLQYGPPSVDMPSGELLANMLEESGDAAGARSARQAALERTPGRRTLLEALNR